MRGQAGLHPCLYYLFEFDALRGLARIYFISYAGAFNCASFPRVDRTHPEAGAIGPALCPGNAPVNLHWTASASRLAFFSNVGHRLQPRRTGAICEHHAKILDFITGRAPALSDNSHLRFADRLQQLRISKLFVAIIGLMWRYLFLSPMKSRMLRARSSRSAIVPGSRGGGNVFWRAKVTGGWLAASSCVRLSAAIASIQRCCRGATPAFYPPRSLQPIAKNDRGYLILGLFLLMLLWHWGC